MLDPGSFDLYEQQHGGMVSQLINLRLVHKQLLSCLVLLSWVRLLKFMRAFRPWESRARHDCHGWRACPNIAILLIWLGFAVAFTCFAGAPPRCPPFLAHFSPLARDAR